ncbi:MAG: hypothetical protein ABIH50_00105 [bacterium]
MPNIVGYRCSRCAEITACHEVSYEEKHAGDWEERLACLCEYDLKQLRIRESFYGDVCIISVNPLPKIMSVWVN